jgi:methyl-accepting chemotaxis protein
MKRLGYDGYGAILGAGLPLVATFIEALRELGSVAPAALLRAHLHQPLLWIMDTTPFVLAALGKVIQRQQDDLVRQSAELVRKSDEIVRLEQARRESFDRTAKDLFHAAQGLLGNVAAFTATTAEAATSVRETTAALNQLSQAATSAALTAETVIGIAVQSERQSEDGLRHAEASSEELLRLAEEVRGLARQIEAVNAELRQVYDVAELVGRIADGSDRLSEAAAELVEGGGPGAARAEALAADVRRQAGETRAGANRVRQVMTEVHRAMLAAVAAAEGGIARARTGARTASETGDAIRGLSTALRDSARAAREIARVAQHQEGAIEQVLKAMNELSHATEGTVAQTHEVAREARSLNELASFLKSATKGG